MLRGEGWPTVARVLQRSCSVCKRFQKYRRTRKQGRGTKILETWSTAYEYSIERCPIPLQCTGLNINVSVTDLVFFNSTYAKKLNKVNRCVSSGGLVGFFGWETAVWPRGRGLSYNWNFLGSFYCALQLKQPFALGGFSLPHPAAQAVSDPEKRFIKVWGEISYLRRTARSPWSPFSVYKEVT